MFRPAARLVLALVTCTVCTSPLSSQSGRATEMVDGHEAVAGEMLVKFRRAMTADELAQLMNQTGADRLEAIGSTGVRRLRSRSLRAQTVADFLRVHPDVEYAEPNYIVHSSFVPNDQSFPNLWGLKNLGQVVNGTSGTAGADVSAPEAWDVSTGSIGNVVGVVDTGINYNHPDLSANVWSAPAAFTVEIAPGRTVTCPAGTHGYNAIARSCDPADDKGHGSHTSGTIGARGNNSVGVAGVNWTTRIMGLKFLDSTGYGSIADAVDAIEFALRTKAFFSGTGSANIRVLSNSWGGEGFSQTLYNEINKANANDILFVASAGNNAQNNDTAASPIYPASYNLPNVVAVAATDSNDQLAGFSNYGQNRVHLAAPGTNVLSTTLNTSFSYLSGTSMAAPHVSGAAMLVLSACSLTTAQLKATLLANVDVLGSLTNLTATGGRLNVNKAIRSCAAAVPAPFGKGFPPSGAQGMPTAGTISWNASAGAASYEYCIDSSSNASCDSGWTPATGTSAAFSGLSTATTYYWQVRASNGVSTTLADGGIWWSFTTPPSTESWFGANWTYRRAITIANNTGAALNDYRALIALDGSFDFSRTLADGADVRITDASGTLSLPLWIEAWNPASRRAFIWVRIQTVPAGGTTLYLYYGNASASPASSAAAVFDIYDGFENTTVGGPPLGNPSTYWSTSDGSVGAVASPVRQGARSLRQSNFSTTSVNVSTTNRGAVGAWMRRASSSGGDNDIYLYAGNSLLGAVGLGGSGRLHYYDGSFHDTSVAWLPSAWYLVTVSFDTAQHRFEFAVFDETLAQVVTGSNLVTVSQTVGLTRATLYTSSQFTGDAFVDDFRIVPSTGTETTRSIGVEETHGGTPPGAFGKATPATGAANQSLSPLLTWATSPGATSYEYCVDTVANAACDTAWTPTASASAALSGLAAGTTYSWQVRAVNSSGTTLADGGAWWTFTTQSLPQNGWLDLAWAYRRPIMLANTTATALTNYQVAVPLDSSNFDFTHAQSDGRDIRVTDATGTTVLAQWIEVWDAAALRATVWVKVPSVPAGGTTLYLYSGNATASPTSNAATTLDVYDGFETLAVGGAPGTGTGITWSVGAGTVAAVGSPARQGTRSIQQTNFTMTSGAFSALTKGTVGSWLRRQSPGGGDADIYLYGNGLLLATVGLGGSGRLHYFDGTFHDTAISWAANTWYFVTMAFDAPQQRFTFTAYDASLRPLVTVPNIAPAANVGSVNAVLLYSSSAFTGSAYVDDFRVLRWTGTETTRTFGAEETRGVPTPPPGPFAKTAPVNGATGVVQRPTLTWSASGGAATYEYCVDTTANAACDTNWTSTNLLSVPLAGLAANTAYSWQVRAVNGGGTTPADGGAWSTFTTQVAWTDPAWAYRRPIALTNATAGTLAGYQVQLTLNSSNFDFTHALSDGRDVRVTDVSGTTPLPFWIETWDAVSLRATIWVRVANIPTAGTTIYLYSGNASAIAAGSAANTFDIYDGFENVSVGGVPSVAIGVVWSVGDPVTAVTSPVREGNRSVQQLNHTATAGNFAGVAKGTIGAWLRRQSTAGGDDDIYLYGNGELLATIGLGGSGRFHYWDGSFHDTALSWTTNIWYFVSASFDATQRRFTFQVFDATLTPLASVPNLTFAGTTAIFNTAMLYTSSAFTGAAFVDDFRVVRWTGAEVSAAVGAEQTP